MQSNPESFSWYVKSLQEQDSPSQMSEAEKRTNLLRMIKLLSPIPVGKLVEISQSELNTSVLEISKILEKLSNSEEITMKEETEFGGQKVVRITELGLAKLEIGA
ncbi:MAG: hypothetical protein ACR2MG_18835 [Pyrinomonadaceae bacterium]